MKPRLKCLFFVLGAICLLFSLNVQAATDLQISTSIEKGFAWLVSQQQSDGSWPYFSNPTACYPSVDIATTGLVVLALEKRAKDLKKNPLNPAEFNYANNVIDGLNYIFTYARSDANGTHLATFGYGVYNTSIAMMAVAMSNAPDRVIQSVGPLNGKTYKEAVQGMMNWITSAQNKSGCEIGGWGYDGVSPGWSDNSNSGYATLGMGFAADFPPQGFGLTIPKEVLDRLETFVANVQVLTGAYEGGSTYNPCWGSTLGWVNILKTGNLLYELGLLGALPDDPRVQSAIGFIQNHWNAPACNFRDGCGWRGDYQAMFALMKGLSMFNIEKITVAGNNIDWFDQVSSYIVDDQNGTGYWLSSSAEEGVSATINTAWALLTLERVVPGYTLNVPLYLQNDDYPAYDPKVTWKKEPLLGGGWYDRNKVYHSCTIGRYGCLLTSWVMIVRSYGITTVNDEAGNDVDVNPLTLNKFIQNDGSYDKCSLNDPSVVERFTNHRIEAERGNAITKGNMNKKLAEDHQPVIVRELYINTEKEALTHFVVATGKTTDSTTDFNYRVRDPYKWGTAVAETLSDSISHFHSGAAWDPSQNQFKPGKGTVRPRLTFNIHSPAEIKVTDPNGRSTGYDQGSGQIITEIPDSSYGKDGGISDLENPDAPPLEIFSSLFVSEPIDGAYRLTVIGTGEGPYTLVTSGQDSQGGHAVQTSHGTIQPGVELAYRVEYSTTNSAKMALSLQVNIDIKPGGGPNSVNPKSKGKIPVAIISTKDFDALRQVDQNQNSLTFGSTGDEQSLAFCNPKGEDINRDGFRDLICHFYTEDTGFLCGDTEGILKGKTNDGTAIEGRDSVRINPCKK